MRSKLRAALSTRRALVVIVAAIVVASWAIPTYGASTFKLAVKALGRANTAVHDSALAVNTSKTANSTANTANSTASAARSTANTANNTANSALSIANGKAQVFLNTTHSFDPPSMNAGECATTTFSQLGVASTDDVILTPPAALDNGIVAQAFPLSGQLKLELCNVTGAAVNPTSLSYRFTIIR